MLRAKAGLILAMFLIGAAARLTYSQDRTITLGDVPPAVSSGAFATTTVLPLKKGDVLPAQFVFGHGCTSSWTVRVHGFVNGDRTAKYPVAGIINCTGSDSDSFGVFASTTVIRADTRTNVAQHSGGYLIEANRAVKAGETVPTLLFMRNGIYSIMSIEPAQGQKGKSDAATTQPWLTAFDERLKPSDRTLILAAWRASNDTVAGLFVVPGLLKLE